MTRFLAVAASLLLVGCSQPAMESLGQGHVAPGENMPSLAGEWRIAGIDGEPFNETYGLALSADQSNIWWSPRCAGFVRSYLLDGSGLRVAPAGTGGGDAVPVCRIAQPARLAEVFQVLDAADRVVRTPSNAIEISGGGRKLTLFSQ